MTRPLPDKPFTIKVMPKSRRTGVEADASGQLVVRVKEPPEDGRANDAVLQALAEYFDLPRRRVRLLRGATSRRKVIHLTAS